MPGPGVTNDSPALAKRGCKLPLPSRAGACSPAAPQWAPQGCNGKASDPESGQPPRPSLGSWADGRVAEEGPLKRLHLQLWLEQLRLLNLLAVNSSSWHLLHPCHVPGTVLGFTLHFL